MKKLLPIENMVLKTSLSEQQVVDRLSANIEAEKSFGFGVHSRTYSKQYIGTLSGSNFEMKRAISYRNSFLPLINGNIKSDINGTRINVKMKPHGFIIAFMAIWIGGVTIGCLVTTYAMITEEFNPYFLIPFVMLLFGIVLVIGGFKTESSKSKKDLIKILEAKIEE